MILTPEQLQEIRDIANSGDGLAPRLVYALLDTVTFWKGRAEELDKALLVIDDMLLREYSFTRIEIIRRMAVIREEIEKRTTPMVTHGDKSGGRP